MAAIDPCFTSVEATWNEVVQFEPLKAFTASLGPLSISRFDFNGFDAHKIAEGMINVAKEKKKTKKPLIALTASLGPLSISRFDFTGFDAHKVAEGMSNVAKEKKKTKMEFFKDLIDIILIGMTRGNIRKDELIELSRTVGGGGVERIQELSATYNIPMRGGAQERMGALVDGNRLTFTRSISVFPHLASLLLHNTSRLARDVYKSTLATDRLPSAMKHIGFSALIPTTINQVIQAIFSYAHAAYMIDFSRMINPAQRAMSIRDIYNLHFNYCKLAQTQSKSIYSDELKIGYLAAFNMNTEAVFNQIFAVASQLHQELHSRPLSMGYVKTTCFKNNVLILAASEAGQTTLTTH